MKSLRISKFTSSKSMSFKALSETTCFGGATDALMFGLTSIETAPAIQHLSDIALSEARHENQRS